MALSKEGIFEDVVALLSHESHHCSAAAAACLARLDVTLPNVPTMLLDIGAIPALVRVIDRDSQQLMPRQGSCAGGVCG